jgi:hypothetical protein
MHQFLDLKRDQAPLKTLAKARLRLEPFAPISHGLDIAGLLETVGVWQAWLELREGKTPAVPVIRVVEDEVIR